MAIYLSKTQFTLIISKPNSHWQNQSSIFISPRILMLGNIWKVHDSSPWQNKFINRIQIHNQSPWFKPMAIYISKTQFTLTISKAKFSLATSKPNSHWQNQSLILIGNIKAHFSLAKSKPNSHWQHQNPVLAGSIKAQFSLAISKLSSRWQYLKPNSHWQYQNPILIGNFKSPTYVDTIKNPS